MSSKTYATREEDVEREWHFFDAEGEVLGRLASTISQLLIGKQKPYYAPYLDCGDHVVVVNAEKVEVTGNKEVDKIYYRHSGYPGGFREERLEQLRERYPEKIIQNAVSKMLPKNKLRDQRLARLRVYQGSEHPHEGQVGESKTEDQEIS